VNVIKWERRTDIVLVGHSYGGMVITGVAEKMGSTIGSILFLGAFVPENGQSILDLNTGRPMLVDAIRGSLEKAELGVSAPSAEFFRVNESDRSWVDAMCTPQPLASFMEPITETGARNRIPKKIYVRASGNPNAIFNGFLEDIAQGRVGGPMKCPVGMT